MKQTNYKVKAVYYLNDIKSIDILVQQQHIYNIKKLKMHWFGWFNTYLLHSPLNQNESKKENLPQLNNLVQNFAVKLEA